MRLGHFFRIAAVGAACVIAGASASSTSNNATPPQYGSNAAPPSQPMDPARALGLWKSTFGAVKIEADNRGGGLQAGALQGVWEYPRQGQDVIGLFWGTLQGNVLQFHWQEPANPPLTGEGYIQFDPEGRQYSGRWWSDRRDRVGDWNGWRQNAQNPQDEQQYGQYQQGGYPQQGQYPQQPQQGQYPAQQGQYPQQPGQYPPPQQGQYPQQPQQYPPQQPYYPQQQRPQYPPPQQGQYPQQPQYPPPQQQQPYYPQQGT